MSGYLFEQQRNHCLLQFTPDLSSMEWPQIESTAHEVSGLVKENPNGAVIADLSKIEAMPEGFVALLVRLWRELDASSREFLVASPQENIRQELNQAGLTSLWKIENSLDECYKQLGVSGDQPAAIPTKPAPAAKAAAQTQTSSPEKPASASEPMAFDDLRGYCAIQFNPVLMTMGWPEVEAATDEVIDKLKQSANNSAVVDLEPMDIINSGLVASLVRIWKTMVESKGQFSLVSPNEMVTDVLKTAGLWKLWSVTDKREDAIYELGAGEVAQVEQRERRMLMLVSLPCSLIGLIALRLKSMDSSGKWGPNAHQIGFLMASAALPTGVLSVIKDKGLRRAFSLLASVLACGVLYCLWFDINPINYARQQMGMPPLQETIWEDGGTSSGNGADNTVKDESDSGEAVENSDDGESNTGDPDESPGEEDLDPAKGHDGGDSAVGPIDLSSHDAGSSSSGRSSGKRGGPAGLPGSEDEDEDE